MQEDEEETGQDSYVALLPKSSHVVHCKDFRAINLLESLNKLFAWLLVSRLQMHWRVPEVQLGGLRGTQVCDALFCAQARVTKESKGKRHGVWLSCDVQSAFDTLRMTQVAKFLVQGSDERLGLEALQLLKLVMLPTLHFHWRDASRQIRQQSGVQQGGSHSALLFSYILGLAISRLDKLWRDRGEPCLHQTFSIAFVDDLLLTFANWSQANRLTMELCAHLQLLGLKLNPKKTKVMTHASVLPLAREVDFSADSLLPHLAWGTSCVYLRKTLTHFEVGAQATGAMELCNTYLGGTWFWYSPAIQPLQKSRCSPAPPDDHVSPPVGSVHSA